jgi:hypothetical protein
LLPPATATGTVCPARSLTRATPSCWPTSSARTWPGRAPVVASGLRPGPGHRGTGSAQQDAVWNRQQIGNQIRSLLCEYYPAALDAFLAKQGGLAREEARIILAKAPTPAEGSRLSLSQLRSALKRAGRVRGVEEEADRLRGVLRAEYAHQPAAVENAFGRQLLALLKQFEAACQASDDLAEAVDASFHEHPDAEILLSFPGLGVSPHAFSPRPATTATASPTPAD